MKIMVQWVVEQPGTSLPFQFRSFMQVRARCQKIFSCCIQRKWLCLGHWGGSLRKPTVLWGISPALNLLHSVRPRREAAQRVRNTTLKTILKDGKLRRVYRIYGVKKTLAASQVYPDQCCSELARHVHGIYVKSLGAFAR